MTTTAVEALKRGKLKAPFRSGCQKAADRAQIEWWRIEGKTERAIVELFAGLGRPYTLSKTQIHNDLAFVEERYRRSAEVDFAMAKGRQLAALERVESEAWAGWERSQNKAETVKEKDGTDGHETSHTLTGQCGDPRFLHVIIESEKRMAALLGLDAPSRVAVNHGSTGQILILKHAHELERANDGDSTGVD